MNPSPEHPAHSGPPPRHPAPSVSLTKPPCIYPGKKEKDPKPRLKCHGTDRNHNPWHRIYMADRMGATGTGWGRRGGKDPWHKQEANSELCVPSEVINIVAVLFLEFPVNLAWSGNTCSLGSAEVRLHPCSPPLDGTEWDAVGTPYDSVQGHPQVSISPN